MELGVRGSPLLPQVSPLWGRAKNVIAPSCICSFSSTLSCIAPATYRAQFHNSFLSSSENKNIKQ